ncbi:hypothetical protein BCF59_0322 [Mycoplasmopsis mustelae]|uniref:Uncharacterized protein n=1 Tax=Mycoplasmopsis mustelae TaxID=171289 RepID=A0A4V6Q6B9_9BACT|nr:hypothetical protein [Mycoplasmopsis mustelae]TDV24360.1 hypothetical protein BCF59_0322 [Mycoplasmopsis mustelae]
MNLIIERLQQKKKQDERTLKIYSIIDTIISSIISFFTIASISLATYILYKLVQISNKYKDVLNSTSFILLLFLVVFIIISFFITVALSIYKYFDRTVQYKKIMNTIQYLDIKYNSRLISKKDLEAIVDTLWEKANKKRKMALSKILKTELKKGFTN